MPLLEESCFASSSPQLLVQQLQRQQVDEVAGRVKVYVYDDPVFDNTALIQCYRDQYKGVAPWQDERADMAQDMGEVWLHQSFLTHPWRVLDPESADLFFIPLLPVLGFKLLGDQRTCDGLTHQQRLTRSIMHLVKKSTHFNRFGGADHIVVCAWWNCRRALSPQHRMLLRRTAVGINEKLDNWAMWGCREKMVTVPYTASSVLTTTEAIGGRRAEERDIPFTFVGTTRGRPERENLKVYIQTATIRSRIYKTQEKVIFRLFAWNSISRFAYAQIPRYKTRNRLFCQKHVRYKNTQSIYLCVADHVTRKYRHVPPLV